MQERCHEREYGGIGNPWRNHQDASLTMTGVNTGDFSHRVQEAQDDHDISEFNVERKGKQNGRRLVATRQLRRNLRSINAEGKLNVPNAPPPI